MILRLSEGIYFGCDYLPHALESWLGEEERSPGGRRRNLSLVEKGSGRTVGYQCIYFMDDFARAVCVALRVEEEARGLGLGTQFIRMGEEEVRRISPTVRMHVARVLNVGEENNQLAYHSSTKAILVKALYNVVVPPKKLSDPENGTLVAERSICFYNVLSLENLFR